MPSSSSRHGLGTGTAQSALVPKVSPKSRLVKPRSYLSSTTPASTEIMPSSKELEPLGQSTKYPIHPSTPKAPKSSTTGFWHFGSANSQNKNCCLWALKLWCPIAYEAQRTITPESWYPITHEFQDTSPTSESWHPIPAQSWHYETCYSTALQTWCSITTQTGCSITLSTWGTHITVTQKLATAQAWSLHTSDPQIPTTH